MNRNAHMFVILASTAFAAVTSGGCDNTPAGDEDARQIQTTDAIAVATTAEGTEVRFYEPAPGEIVVTAHGKAGADLSAMKLVEGDDPSALALYDTLTHQPAPGALVAAHDRARTAMRQPLSDADLRRLDVQKQSDDVTVTTGALTSAQFQNSYCSHPGLWTYTSCLTNYDAPFTVDRFGAALGCRVQGQRGKTLMIHQTWLLSWSSMSFTVDPQEMFNVYTYGPPTERRCYALPLPDATEARPRFDVTAWAL